MSLVVLSSGGVDSTLISVMAAEEGQVIHPLFVDYGQRAARREWGACRDVYAKLGLPKPRRVQVAGYGKLVRSGLTDPAKGLVSEAFTPGRNGLLLLLGASHAFGAGARAVAIGLLREEDSIFPDQTSRFLKRMESAIEAALGLHVGVRAPLLALSKRAVIALAKERGIVGTYSCHAGGSRPCGKCISCREARGASARDGRR